MKFNTLKKDLKKDPAGSPWISIYRKIGLFLTYILINLFPRIKANTVTIIMFVLNIISVFLLYFSIINNAVYLAAISIFIHIVGSSLDCTDGNIARIKKETSYQGIFIDRLAHNIHHPLFYLVIGLAITKINGEIIYMLIYSIFAILSEFSPIEMAKKDVKSSFVNQLISRKSLNFDISTHVKDIDKENNDINKSLKHIGKNKMWNIFKMLFSFFMSYEMVLIIITITLLLSLEFMYVTIYIFLLMGIKVLRDFTKSDLKVFMVNLKRLEDKLND